MYFNILSVFTHSLLFLNFSEGYSRRKVKLKQKGMIAVFCNRFLLTILDVVIEFLIIEDSVALWVVKNLRTSGRP